MPHVLVWDVETIPDLRALLRRNPLLASATYRDGPIREIADYCESDVVNTWRRTATGPRERIDEFLGHWKETNVGVFNAAFVPVFMSLRILSQRLFL
jgi:hypothetical protein